MKNCKKCCVDIPDSFYSGLCYKCRKHENYMNSGGKYRKHGRKVYTPEEIAREKRVRRQLQAEYRKRNRDLMRRLNKEWYECNGKEYYANRYKNNLEHRLRTILRSRLCIAVKDDQKAGSAVDDLGCSIYELKQHIESQFEPGMSWNNYGDWHIDHIKPLSSFKLSDREQLREACHYTNLQPLWAEDNLKKAAKII